MLSRTQATPTPAAERQPPMPYMRDLAVEQACERIIDAGLAGARWAFLPEGSIPSYPAWVWALPLGDNLLLEALHAELLANAVRIPSDVTDRLCRAAERAQVNVVVGVIERDDTDDGTAYFSTLLRIDSQGRIVATCRTPCSREAARLEWIPTPAVRIADEAPAISHVGGI